MFTLDDFQLFERYTPAVNFGSISQTDKDRFRSVRTKVDELANSVASLLRDRGFRTHTSILNPNGNTAKDYWCALCPPNADNKSYSAQIALIVSAKGVELCFCLGSGEAQINDPISKARNENHFAEVKRNLANLPEHLRQLLEHLDNQWLLRRRWRMPGGVAEFSTVDEWIEYASGPSGAGASISSYLLPTEAISAGEDIGHRFGEAVETFLPLLEWLDQSHPEQAAEPDAHANDAQVQVWLIAPGEGGRLWEDFKRQGLASIGWDGLDDLNRYQTKEDMAAEIRAQRNDGIEPVNDSLACWEFCNDMNIGDVIYAKRGVREILGLGIVRSEYRYDPNRTEYKHVRTIEWTHTGNWPLPDTVQLPVKSLTNITRFRELRELLERLLEGQQERESIAPIPVTPFTLNDAVTDTFLSMDEWRQITRVWARKKNLIVQGPPGVGKSFLAKRLAYSMIGERAPSRVLSLQFHQSYSYEDFMQGYRPHEGGLKLLPGVFHDFCTKARGDQERLYVAIIDEFNRANVSRVLGEAMVLIEPDKRSEAHAIPLAYSLPHQEPFWIPENLLVLGLMNTADRSLSFVDFALRRRFAFVNLRPAFEKPSFREYLLKMGVEDELAEQLIQRMTALNQKIAADDRNLGSGFEIGHSFFCPTGSEATLDADWYNDVVANEVIPLVEEYWAGRPDEINQCRLLLKL